MGTCAQPLPRSCQRPAGLADLVGLARGPCEPVLTDARATPSAADRPAPSPPPDGSRGGTYPVAPPPPAAAIQPAALPTIFCRRPGLGGGYQPPLRRRQPTQPSAPGRRAPGAARRSGGTGVGRSRCSGPSAPRGYPSPGAEALGPEAARAWQGWVAAALRFVIVDSALPPQSTPGNNQPGEGRSGRYSQASAHIRKSLSCLDGRGSAGEPSFWLAGCLSSPDPGRYSGAPGGPPQGELDLLAWAGRPCQTWSSPNQGTRG